MRRRPTPAVARLHRMTVASQTFLLPSSDEAARLKRACVAAARRGGGLVPVVSAGGERLEVLVTPGLPVFFEVVQLQPFVEDDDADEGASFEWEYSDSP